jgi:hypothetical protein
MLDKTSSIICAFGLASAAPRSPYRHLELCGIALKVKRSLKISADECKVQNENIAKIDVMRK